LGKVELRRSLAKDIAQRRRRGDLSDLVEDRRHGFRLKALVVARKFAQPELSNGWILNPRRQPRPNFLVGVKAAEIDEGRPRALKQSGDAGE